MNRKPKKRLIYSNYPGEMYTDDDARDYLFDEYAEEEGWEKKSDIPDQRVWDEINAHDEMSWEDEKYELEKFFDGGHWILQGTLGLWNGPHRGGYTFEDFKGLARCWNNLGYISIYDKNGHFLIDAYHHDGTNHYEVKRLTDKGCEYLNNHVWDPLEATHNAIFENNFLSALPHYANIVFGCKKRESAA